MRTRLQETPISSGLENVTTIAYMMKWYPRETVEAAIEACGNETLRSRQLPMDLMFYHLVMWGLNRKDSATEALEKLLAGAKFIYGRPIGPVPARSAIVQARQKLGDAPLRTVFEQRCKPLAAPDTPGAFFREWRLTALDGCLMNVADSKQNEIFGRPSNQNATPAAYPQIRMVCLGECGTHAIFEAEFGGYGDSESVLAKKVLSKLKPDMLCLMDRLFFGYSLWRLADSTGAALLWRVKSNTKLEPVELLPDGSYTAHYYPSARDHENRDGDPILVRVVDCERRSEKPRKTENMKLVTNIMNPADASADELARLYCQRWEIELVYGELKTRLNENQVYLKSNLPETVRQELWGLLLAHYIVRAVIFEAATSTRRKLDPDDISFIGTVNVLRREIGSGDFSP